MTTTAITCTTPARRAGMDLCLKYLARQTKQPDQHLILDGPEPMPAKILAAIEGGLIKGEVVTFIEDDDAIRADWLEWCHEQIAVRGFDMAGECMAVYYQVKFRWWSECRNCRHAALVQTAIHSDLLENVANVIRSYQSAFFDTRIWALDANKFLALPKSNDERRIWGIKGMFGAAGYSGEHAQFHPPGTHPDPAMTQLWRWIGQDAEAYLRFFDRPTANP